MSFEQIDIQHYIFWSLGQIDKQHLCLNESVSHMTHEQTGIQHECVMKTLITRFVADRHTTLVCR